MKPIIPADSRPKKCLGLEPVIETLVDAGVAIAELAWLDSRESTVQTACKQRIDLIKADAESELVVRVGRTSVSFADRRKALTGALLDWCRANRELVLADLDGKKTRPFTHGDVKFAESPIGLAWIEEFTAADLLGQIDDACDCGDGGLKLWLAQKLHGLKLTESGRVRVSHAVKVKVEIDLAGLLAMHKRGDVTGEDLAELGLEIARTDERISVKTKEYAVASQPAAV